MSQVITLEMALKIPSHVLIGIASVLILFGSFELGWGYESCVMMQSAAFEFNQKHRRVCGINSYLLYEQCL